MHQTTTQGNKEQRSNLTQLEIHIEEHGDKRKAAQLLHERDQYEREQIATCCSHWEWDERPSEQKSWLILQTITD
eukprot:2126272-Amphidinium_carterae.2